MRLTQTENYGLGSVLGSDVSCYYYNGILHSQFSKNRYGEKNGRSFEYFPEGQLKKIQDYFDGWLVEYEINFYQNGHIRSIGLYNCDCSKLEFEINYVFLKEEDYTMEYTIERNYINKKCGEWLYFFDDGSLEKTQNHEP